MTRKAAAKISCIQRALRQPWARAYTCTRTHARTCTLTEPHPGLMSSWCSRSVRPAVSGWRRHQSRLTCPSATCSGTWPPRWLCNSALMRKYKAHVFVTTRACVCVLEPPPRDSPVACEELRQHGEPWLDGFLLVCFQQHLVQVH